MYFHVEKLDLQCYILADVKLVIFKLVLRLIMNSFSSNEKFTYCRQAFKPSFESRLVTTRILSNGAKELIVLAIKGGLVVKSMNVDTRGRPALKFKEIKGIYNLRDTVYHNQVPTIYLRDDLESSPTKFYVVKAESSDPPLVRGIKIKSEPEDSDFNCNNDGGERNNDQIGRAHV